MAKLARTTIAITKAGKTAIARVGPSLVRGNQRRPLDFVPERPNPLEGLADSKSLEEKSARELDAFGKAFREAVKQESAAAAHELEGYGSEYFVCVFRDAAQATSFLKAIKYPDPYDVFVDGPMVADLAGIKIAEPLMPLPKKLKVHHDKKLLPLITRKI